MGYFQAKKKEDDQHVTFSNGSITNNTFSNTTPSIENYYYAILNAVNLGFTKNDSQENNIDETFKKRVEQLWGESLPTSFGYFTNVGNEDVMDRIAEEENKYYWQWMDNGEVKDDDENVILNQFRIVNTRLIDRMFVNSDKAKGNLNTWKKEKKHQNDIVPSIVISPNHFVYLKTVADADPKPRLLFLDEAETTQRFHYEKEDTDYKEQRTWNYDAISDVDYSKNSEEHKIILSNKLNEQGDLDKLRYYEAYKQAYNKFIKSSACTEKKDSIKSNYNPGEKIKKLLDIDETIKKKLGDSIYNQKKDEFQEIAERTAQELPKKTHCFYYDDTPLKGFISTVPISEGGKGGSGYEMRADKVNEVNYQFIQQGTDDDDAYLHFLVRYRLFGLNNEHVGTEPPTIKKNRNTNGNSFYPTNWPYDKNFINTKIGETGNAEDEPMTGQSAEGLTMNSRFWYYKNFKSGVERRNKPQKNPFPPRLTNNQFGNYKYFYNLREVEENTNNSKKYVKLDKTSYRKWKKVNKDNTPLQLGTNENKRIDAGTAMAEALRGFHIHQNMINESNLTPKVSNTKLPATAFVKHVLDTDEEAQQQWKMDNLMDADVTKESLKTDQEWCHLLGHGDGGSEDLSNFVAGSKHCNTEQLAIEVGQRRVTHADFFTEEAKDITAKITAYLLPNQGTWLTEGTYTATDLEGKLGGPWDGYENNNYTDWRDQFFLVGDVEYTYQLKPPTDCKTAFDSLSDKISEPNIDKDLKKYLLKYKHSIETHFFMYLPIARWMRYKIYYRHKKVFDHIYDAQSESTNVHECQILDDTVERVLYKAIAATADEKRREVINLHYKTSIVGRSLKFIPDESLREEFKETVERQKKIDRLWSSKKRDRNGNPPEIDGLIKEVSDKMPTMDVDNDPLREFYKKILQEQQQVLKGLEEGRNTGANVPSRELHTTSSLSESPKKRKTIG